MERLLRGKNPVEVSALFEQSFNYEKQVLFFPVRHHSPACSFHLKQVIEAYEPEVILIEGPQNANELLGDLSKEGNTPPFCIYLSYDDLKGVLGEAGGKYRAYYPLLEYSPELNAILEAEKRKIPCEFIDLPFHEKLYYEKEMTRDLETSQQEDQLFTCSDYYKLLTEKMGCKNFNELWEKLFEINGLYKPSKDFVESVFTYCYYSRSTISEEELASRGDLAREQFMRTQIKRAKEKYEKILVVTGGIHTIALASEAKEEESTSQTKLGDSPPTYLMPYSYEASDQSSGYEAGMAFPYFYQKVWELLQKKKKQAYEEAVLSFIIKVAGQMRKKQALSITDEMQSFYLAKGLADLRDKQSCGVFELIDAVQSAFVKGQRNTHYEPVLHQLYGLLTGLAMGRVTQTQNQPPIVLDFLGQCKRFKLSTTTSLAKETKLDVAGDSSHQQKSYFFYQMAYLGTEFCQYKKGQDERTGVGRILLRETWQYRYTPKVQAVLIDQCVYGGTVRQACLYLVSKAIRETHHTAESLSQLLLQAEKMGLDELYEGLTITLETVMTQDMNFLSVGKCFECLSLIAERRQLKGEGVSESFKKIRALALNRMKNLFETLNQAPKDEEEAYCERLKFAYEALRATGDLALEEMGVLQAAKTLFEEPEANSAIVGTCGGILLKRQQLNLEEIVGKLSWYLQGSQKAKKQAAAFLKGFFKIAKDTVFIEPQLLKLIDQILNDTEGEAFLEILPDLRLAFTYFLPFEIDQLAQQIAGFYGLKPKTVLETTGISLEQLERAKVLEQKVETGLAYWFGGEAHE